MNHKTLLSLINQIRIDSKWALRSNNRASEYCFVGAIMLKPHEHVSVNKIEIVEDKVLITVIHRHGDIAVFDSNKFIRLFKEINYPSVIIKHHIDTASLFELIYTKFDIQMDKYYNHKTREVKFSNDIFDVIVFLEKNDYIPRIRSKREKLYFETRKESEESYGL